MTTPATPAWLNIDAIVPAILRDDVPDLRRAAETMLDAVAAFIERVPELRSIEQAISAARLPDGVPEAVEAAIGLDVVRAHLEAAATMLDTLGCVMFPQALRLELLDGDARDTVAGVVRWMTENDAREYLIARA